ncbi:MAG: hypothetical protein NZ552_08270 [Planctomycetes bacterium]|nr:hypothetical protein [Planctomycetota bacterium]
MSKYLFWIVCAVVFLLLIIGWLFLVPVDAAHEAKRSLDNKMRDLNRLVERAERGSPEGVFDPEKPEDTRRLSEEYLITDDWQRVLQPLVKKYEENLDGIAAQLLARRGWLARPIAPSKSYLEWYNEYIALSEALIDRLRTGGCLRAATDDEQRSTLGESPAAVRQMVGLYTKSTDYPQPSEHLRLTVRLRAMELIAERLLAARVAITDNPVIGPTGLGSERQRSVPRLVAVEWLGAAVNPASDADDGMRPISQPLAGRVQPRALAARLTLEGTPGALLAAIAELERNTQPERPLVAITAAQLSRRDQVRGGERFDVADDSVRLTAALEIIEFAPVGNDEVRK